MDESDIAHRLLADLETTLTGVRARLADLALLAEPGRPPAVPQAEGASQVLPSAEALCRPAARAVPAALVLPSEVDAPHVVLRVEAGGADVHRLVDDGARLRSASA